ncbi:cullin-4A [Phakopsora pachyrhizi]|uniref:Cullin-4A n=1 Tax=Phakopsora pachyrhizi TaxID=170000 RepID=A0AAV0BV15_PHAPC|nr:cullin-4A [Phakopsora pachyrhizi]
MSSSNSRKIYQSTINLSRSSSKVKPTKRQTEPASDNWSRLSKAISEILNHNASKLSFEEHYRYAYNMVLFKQGTKLRDLVSNHLDNQALSKIQPNFPIINPLLSSSNPQLMISSTTETINSSRISDRAVDNPSRQTDSSDPNLSSSQKGKARAVDPLPADDEQSDELFATQAIINHQISLITSGNASDRLSVIQSQERFLKAVRGVWDDHVACMKKLRDVLKYMDKVYTTSPGNGFDSMPTVWDLGLYIFLHPYRIITLITSERLGDTVNSSVIRSSTDMLKDLSNHGPEIIKRIDDRTGGYAGGGRAGQSIYKTDFEPVFLSQSREFYREEANRLLSSCDASQYLRKVEKRLIEEDIRSQAYLHESTGTRLRCMLNEVLLESQAKSILNHTSCGLSELIQNDSKEDLKRLYRLFCRIQQSAGVEFLKDGIKEWIKDRGQQINDILQRTTTRSEVVTAQGSVGNGLALQWVMSVIELRGKFIRLLSESFDQDKVLQTCIDEGFSHFINSNRRAAEFISLFIDDKLKKGLKGKTDEEIEDQLEKTISLYRHLNEKDLFEKYYKNHLAKRLLFGKSISEDTERNMLIKLKVESGSAFTRDSEGMLKDIKMSDEMAKSFKEWCQKNNPSTPLDLVVTVGSSSMWPMSQNSSSSFSSDPLRSGSSTRSCILPKVLEDSIKLYEKFYSTRHSGRRLNWHTELGSLEIKIKFKRTVHELSLSTFAGIVLLLFDGLEEDKQMSYEEIKAATSIMDQDLKRTLQSLSCAKYKILLKDPKSKEIDEKLDRFRFNVNFTSQMSKIKIQTVTNRVENREQFKETNDRVEEDRRLHTEACIVRIMKTRKRLNYLELNNEVLSQLSKRFRPSSNVIKTSIEKLIEKEFLIRDAEDRKVIIYLVSPSTSTHF